VNKLPETTLAWLRQTAKFEGAVTAQALLHVLGRLEALEAAQQQPTPEAAPVATDNGLVRCYAQAVEDALKAGHGIDCAAAAALRAVYNLDRQHVAAQPPAAQPTPPAAPAGGLVERVEARAGGDGRAAIREVAAWLDSNAGLPDDATPCEADGWELAAHILNREADR
jgi:hypothetical protein